MQLIVRRPGHLGPTPCWCEGSSGHLREEVGLGVLTVGQSHFAREIPKRFVQIWSTDLGSDVNDSGWHLLTTYYAPNAFL